MQNAYRNILKTFLITASKENAQIMQGISTKFSKYTGGNVLHNNFFTGLENERSTVLMHLRGSSPEYSYKLTYSIISRKVW